MHKGGQQECNSYYIDMKEWMNIPDDGETQHGKIYCPNPKCKCDIGNYAHYGGQCSCGCWVNPSYQLSKAKIDEIIKVNIEQISVRGMM